MIRNSPRSLVYPRKAITDTGTFALKLKSKKEAQDRAHAQAKEAVHALEPFGEAASTLRLIVEELG